MVIMNIILFHTGISYRIGNGVCSVEIRTLRYFLAVAREENMTRAAEALHVTQPTLSKALRALEDELGKKLFTRHSFSIALTEEGALLRDRAEDLITMADRIEEEFLALDDITGGDLYFGLAESYQIRCLARALRVLKGQYPGLKYHITSGDTEQVTEKLDRGLLDFAVICDTPNARKYGSIAFPEGDTWGLILPADAPLARKDVIRIDDLVGLPLFTSRQGWEGDIRQWAGERFAELRLEGSFRLAYNASMFVREGLGYQLSFRNLVDVSPASGLAFRPLFPRLETKLYLIWNRYQAFTPIAERFLAQVRSSFLPTAQA